MQTAILPGSKSFLAKYLVLFLSMILFTTACKKTELSPNGGASSRPDQGSRKPPKDPPPPPPFYFSNCTNPIYFATFQKGVPANTTLTKNYINSPGGSYPAYTSATVNGITATTAAGVFNAGTGTVTYTLTGTPVATGTYSVTIGAGNIIPCAIYFKVINAPASGPNADPGSTEGSTGVVNFIYRGQAVAYYTVRAADGRIWLQQNLGSPQVAIGETDQASYGDYFQWGRWDDGHQARTSATITGGSSLLNPSNIPSGYPYFIKGSTAATRWWGMGGLASDTWSA
ncbi:MAG TPA: hypothetical protein VM187_17905, partial [Niastella sp.]|nr:hypothetical protein [Niastella sp.]